MTNISFKEILSQYNDSVSAVRDLENALTTLIGKAEWEDDIMSDKRKSIQVLYEELKAQRNVREELEGNIYSLEQGNKEEGVQTEASVESDLGKSKENEHSEHRDEKRVQDSLGH